MFIELIYSSVISITTLLSYINYILYP